MSAGLAPSPISCKHNECGCWASGCCLSCPLPECVLVTSPFNSEAKSKDQFVARDLALGFTAQVVADKYKIGVRTVFNSARRYKSAVQGGVDTQANVCYTTRQGVG